MNRFKKSIGATSTRIIVWLFIALTFLFITVASLLYLNGTDRVWGFTWLVFLMLSLLLLSFLFILGLRVAQKDGYLDGFAAGDNHARKPKKKK